MTNPAFPPVAAGHWTTYSGKPLIDPPAGTYKRVKPGTGSDTTGWVSYGFPASKDAVVWAWVQKYTETSNPNGFSSRPDHVTVVQLYNQVLDNAPKKATNPDGPLPDPGAATPGVGPVSGLGITSILDFLKLLTKPQTWLRVGEVVLGIVLVGVAVAKITENELISNAVGKITGPIK